MPTATPEIRCADTVKNFEPFTHMLSDVINNCDARLFHIMFNDCGLLSANGCMSLIVIFVNHKTFCYSRNQ